MSFYKLCLTLFFIGIVSSTEYTKCVDEPEPINVNVTGCAKPPCSFVKGTNANLLVDILVNNNITALTAKVKALAMGTETVYPLPQSNACLSLTNGECPLDEGEEVTYQLAMPILSSYPSIPLIIEFSLVSEKGVVACFKISALVVDP